MSEKRLDGVVLFAIACGLMGISLVLWGLQRRIDTLEQKIESLMILLPDPEEKKPELATFDPVFGPVVD